MSNSPIKREDKDRGEDEEEEDALSLCDFPQISGEAAHHRRRSSQPSDSFEFSNDLDSGDMSHAEDIIHCGKLKPYKQQSEQKPLSDDRIFAPPENCDSADFSRRHCDSLPPRTNTFAAMRLTRSSRSLDRKKLRRNSSLVMKSEASEIHRSLSEGVAKSEAPPRGWKPRWYDLMFGSVKFPPEIDLRDMKNRQIRRNPGSMFAAADGGDGTPANRSERASSWGHDLLSVLSCKNHPSSVAVTASTALVPQLRSRECHVGQFRYSS